MSKHIVRQNLAVGPAERAGLFGHKSACVWFTGYSGAGKSTLANQVERQLYERAVHTFLLDGDNIRHGLCRDLGFDEGDRRENVRRVAEVARLFVEAGLVAVTALISPFRADRQAARALFAPGQFVEVYVKCPLEVCMSRDPKGLYKKAMAGSIAQFTGIGSPYEEPEHPDITVDTARMTVEECGQVILEFLSQTLDLAHQTRIPG